LAIDSCDTVLWKVSMVKVRAVAISATLVLQALPGSDQAQSANAGAPVRLERSEEAMGSSFSLVLYGADRARLEVAADLAFREAHRLDAMLSNYRPESEWSRINREAAAHPVEVSPELFSMLSSCLKYSRQSNGAFDITVGPLMKVWGFYKGEGSMPRPADVTDALSKVGYRHVFLDRDARTVRFTRPGIELDPGGIGKGYAVDRIVDVLKREGVDSALVSASGSSIYGLGAPPEDSRGWPITISRPGEPGEAAATVFLRDMSLSTSGSYEKFFWAEGRTYSHIMNPRTGYPARGTSSVSVLAARTLDSEAWTKPFFINGRDWTRAHKPEAFRVFFCDDRPQAACSWM
jgi:FAD:protein FMN transferase